MNPHISSKKASKKSGTILQIKLNLLEAHIPIWRRVLLPASFNLQQLNEIFQMAMGWKNSHLYRFEINGEEYGDHEAEFEDEPEVKKAIHHTLSDIVGKTNRFLYFYDFGDNWQHEVLIEQNSKWDENYSYPVCIGGENACPPEDCGGSGGYEELLRQLADKNDEEHSSTKRWLGGFFDPRSFDPNRINHDHLWMKKW
ncbi:MAG: hypothetical protein COT74_05995 [Bdellovibrionales bacterium CG10_big_fil_rev_8_21_14_0_10_45_34]|nr:MAG: hypothetical protein COT74_05995 [Bdellovibrionales bacterium CG10_big_fil_rev_8_21_14_0_10_45_34]